MKRNLRSMLVGVALLAAFALATSCASDSTAPPAPGGHLTVEFDLSANKTLWPVGWADSIGDFWVVVNTAGLQDSLYQAQVDTPGTVRFEDIPPGLYDVEVWGFCAASDYCATFALIAFGLAENVNVVFATDTEVTVAVKPYDGEPGAAAVTLEWHETCDFDRIELFVRPITGSWSGTPHAVLEGVDIVGTSALFTIDPAPAGSHVLLFQLMKGEDLISTAIEVLNVYGSYTTVGVVTLTEADCQDPTPEPGPCDNGYDVTLEFQWTDAPANKSLFLASECNDWDLSATEMFIPDASFVFPNGANDDGIFEFEIIDEQGAPNSCWPFNDWTLNGAMISQGDCRLLVDCSAYVGLEGILVFIDVDTATVSAYCLPVETNLAVIISVQDPAATAPLNLDCAWDEANVACQVTHVDGFGEGATFQWYVNGVGQAGLPDATAVFMGLVMGDRIAVVVHDGEYGASAEFTVPDPNPPLPPALPIVFDFTDGSRDAVVGESTISREPAFTGSYVHTSSNKTLYTSGWDGGTDTKYWIISFSTEGFGQVLLNSAQWGSGTAPADFKIQYRVGAGTWTDVTGGTVLITGTTDATATVVTDLALPADASDESSVSIRWLMASETNINGTAVASGGNSRIRDISVTGTALP